MDTILSNGKIYLKDYAPVRHSTKTSFVVFYESVFPFQRQLQTEGVFHLKHNSECISIRLVLLKIHANSLWLGWEKKLRMQSSPLKLDFQKARRKVHSTFGLLAHGWEELDWFIAVFTGLGIKLTIFGNLAVPVSIQYPPAEQGEVSTKSSIKLILFIEIGSPDVGLSGVEFMVILVPLPPKCWDCRHAPLRLVYKSSIKIN